MLKAQERGLELVRASEDIPQESDHTAENQKIRKSQEKREETLEAEGTAQAKPNRVRGLVKAGWGRGEG